jgi:secernin
MRFRQVCSLLESSVGHLDIDAAKRILRDHYQGTFIRGPQFHPFLPDFHTICMHESPSGFTWGNTATSVIVELDPEGAREPRLNVAYQPPCTSVYLGFTFSEPLPALLTRTGNTSLGVFDPTSVPNDNFDESSLWWRLHRIVQATSMSPDTRYAEILQRFRDVETQNKVLYSSDREMQDDDKSHAIEKQLERLISEIEELERRWHL